jgi:hypothetical protein
MATDIDRTGTLKARKKRIKGGWSERKQSVGRWETLCEPGQGYDGNLPEAVGYPGREKTVKR